MKAYDDDDDDNDMLRNAEYAYNDNNLFVKAF